MDVLTWFVNLSSGHERSLAAANSPDSSSSSSDSSSAFTRVFVRMSLEQAELQSHLKRAAPQAAASNARRGKRNANACPDVAADHQQRSACRDALRCREFLLRTLRREESIRRPPRQQQHGRCGGDGIIGDSTLAKNIAPRIQSSTSTSTSTRGALQNGQRRGTGGGGRQHHHHHSSEVLSSHSMDLADELMSKFILLPDLVHHHNSHQTRHHHHHPGGKTPNTCSSRPPVVSLTIDPDFLVDEDDVEALVSMANGLIHSSPAASAPIASTVGHNKSGARRKRHGNIRNTAGFLSKKGIIAAHKDCGPWPSWYVGGLANLEDENDGNVYGLEGDLDVSDHHDCDASFLFHGDVSAELLKVELVLFALARIEMTIRGSYRQALRAIAMSRTASSKFSSSSSSHANAAGASSKVGGKGKEQQDICTQSRSSRAVFLLPADELRRRHVGARPDRVSDWMESLLDEQNKSNLQVMMKRQHRRGVCIPVELLTHVLSVRLSTNGHGAGASQDGLDLAVRHLIGEYYDTACLALPPPPPPATSSPRRMIPSKEDRANDHKFREDKAKVDKVKGKAKDKAKDSSSPPRARARSTGKVSEEPSNREGKDKTNCSTMDQRRSDDGDVVASSKPCDLTKPQPKPSNDEEVARITGQDPTSAEPAKESPSEVTMGATATATSASITVTKKKKKRKKKKKKKGGADNAASADQSPPSPGRDNTSEAPQPANVTAPPNNKSQISQSQTPQQPPRNPSPRRDGDGGSSPVGSSGSATAAEERWEVVASRPKGRNSRSRHHQQNDKGKFPSSSSSPYMNGHHRRFMHRQSNAIVRDVLSMVLDNVWSEVDARRQEQQQQEQNKKQEKYVKQQILPGANSSGMCQAVHRGNPPPVDKSKANEKRPSASAVETAVMGSCAVSSKRLSNISPATSCATDQMRKATITSGAHNADQDRKTIVATSTKKPTGAPAVIPASKDVDNSAPRISKQASIEGPINSADLSQDAAASVPVPAVLGMPEAGLLDDDRSASSSVSSSLETPSGMHHLSRGRRRRGTHRRSSQGDEEGEGYPLLNLCDRLSTDMSLFMHRRAHALEDRRLERRLLLGALQGTVEGIWTPGCHVEMYGSCATQLDLPSSDLDLVVRGVDAVGSVGVGGGKKKKQLQHRQQREIQAGLEAYQHSFGYGSFTPNGARVLRLAMELERQPWAVQVKPIPTAMIPVVKVLADPTRLPGAAKARMGTKAADFVHRGEGVAWAAAATAGQRGAADAMRAQQPVVAGHHTVPSSSSSSDQATAPPVAQMMIPPPWRGADLLNGLLSVDITFEGAGHGGVGSTAYAARVVQEACDESGLPPDATPAVRITMVLKELLAQRRLNEPFSGGLSSYSLLLMVCAVIREAKLIRMDRAEQQRKAAAAVDDATETLPESGAQQPAPKAADDSSTCAQSTVVSPGDVNDGGTSLLPAGSTWAAVAKSKPTEKTSMKKEKQDAAVKNQSVPSYAEKASGKGALKKGRNHSSSATAMNRSTTTSPTVAMTLSSEDVGNSNVVDSNPVGAANNLPHWVSNPHGVSNDILDVLCSGEATAGKLLMHFFLFYGKYFDAQTMAIDMNSPYSPFVPRKSGGQIDPVTGVFSVDPLVVYDPLEGQEGNNVARSCFAWYSIRQVFSQCFATLVQSLESQVLGGENGNEMVPLLALLLSF